MKVQPTPKLKFLIEKRCDGSYGKAKGRYALSLGHVIDPDCQIDLYCDRIDF